MEEVKFIIGKTERDAKLYKYAYDTNKHSTLDGCWFADTYSQKIYLNGKLMSSALTVKDNNQLTPVYSFTDNDNNTYTLTTVKTGVYNISSGYIEIDRADAKAGLMSDIDKVVLDIAAKKLGIEVEETDEGKVRIKVQDPDSPIETKIFWQDINEISGDTNIEI